MAFRNMLPTQRGVLTAHVPYAHHRYIVELIEAVNEVLREVNENGQYKAWYDEYSDYAKSLGIEN